MRRINLGDIVRSGNDTGEVCFISTHYFCMCVRMGAIALYDVKVVVSRTLNDFEIIRKVDSDSLESVTKEIEKKYMYNELDQIKMESSLCYLRTSTILFVIV